VTSWSESLIVTASAHSKDLQHELGHRYGSESHMTSSREDLGTCAMGTVQSPHDILFNNSRIDIDEQAFLFSVLIRDKTSPIRKTLILSSPTLSPGRMHMPGSHGVFARTKPLSVVAVSRSNAWACASRHHRALGHTATFSARTLEGINTSTSPTT
jgi:hypothetical protein